MQRRQGTTLMEVLVAIFVMGIGTLCIMAMFPLAAISMARSIKDDRVGHAVANAKAIAIANSIRYDSLVTPYFDNPTSPATPGSYVTPADGPSWAVYCDPAGTLTYLGASNTFVTGAAGNTGTSGVPGATGAIPRTSLSFINNNSVLAIKWCSLLDDITFGPNGIPLNTSGQPIASGGNIARTEQYSYAWLLRRPKAGNKEVVDLTVIVYSQRVVSGIQTANETAYAVQVNAAQPNLVTVQWNSGAGIVQPQIAEGGWILDISQGPGQGAGNTKPFMPGNATFYRVVGIGDITSAGATSSMTLELAYAMPTNATAIVVMDRVVEVIQCGDSWRSWSN